MFRADRGGLPPYNPYPCREPRGDNPHPRPDRSPTNPLPPWNKSAWPRRWRVLVLLGPSLGLGPIPRYVGGRKNSKALGKAEARAGVEAGRVAKVERVGPKDGGG